MSSSSNSSGPSIFFGASNNVRKQFYDDPEGKAEFKAVTIRTTCIVLATLALITFGIGLAGFLKSPFALPGVGTIVGAPAFYTMIAGGAASVVLFATIIAQGVKRCMTDASKESGNRRAQEEASDPNTNNNTSSHVDVNKKN